MIVVKAPVPRMTISSVGALLVLALVVFVLGTLSGLPRTTHPSTQIAPTIVTSPEDRPAQSGGPR